MMSSTEVPHELQAGRDRAMLKLQERCISEQ